MNILWHLICIRPYIYIENSFFAKDQLFLADSLHPEVKWAQRPDVVYLTVMLPDAKDPKVNLDPEGIFNFSATAGAGDRPYELKLELQDKVNVEVGGHYLIWQPIGFTCILVIHTCLFVLYSPLGSASVEML